MSFTLSVPPAYGFVILGTGLGSFVANMMMSGKVMSAREQYKVEYPNLYAVPGFHKQADEFNRVQRGHQNYLEGVDSYVVMTLLGGLKFPIACAVGTVFYFLGCILYAKGYSDNSVDVKVARHKKGGPIKYIGLLTSLISMCSLAYSVITA
ncbi:MAG: hypothetical protein SGILL_004705 [Bacillariaceae sp.]